MFCWIDVDVSFDEMDLAHNIYILGADLTPLPALMIYTYATLLEAGRTVPSVMAKVLHNIYF